MSVMSLPGLLAGLFLIFLSDMQPSAQTATPRINPGCAEQGKSSSKIDTGGERRCWNPRAKP